MKCGRIGMALPYAACEAFFRFPPFGFAEPFLSYIRSRIAISAAGRKIFYGFFEEYTRLRRCSAFSSRFNSGGVGVPDPIRSSKAFIVISSKGTLGEVSRSCSYRRKYS